MQRARHAAPRPRHQVAAHRRRPAALRRPAARPRPPGRRRRRAGGPARLHDLLDRARGERGRSWPAPSKRCRSSDRARHPGAGGGAVRRRPTACSGRTRAATASTATSGRCSRAPAGRWRRASPCNTVVDCAWPFERRVWTLGRLVVIGGALVATFLVFAAVAVRVAVRARDVTVPDLTGASLADAAARLGREQLSLRVDAAQRPSTEVPAGRVLGQDPRPDTSSRRQRIGPGLGLGRPAGRRTCPAWSARPSASARIRLSQEGLDATSVSEIRSEAFAADQVVAQEPPPGQPAAAVRLLVSRGADAAGYVMPDLIGLAGEPAAAILRQQGFRVSFVAQQVGQRAAAGPDRPAGAGRRLPGAPRRRHLARGRAVTPRLAPSILSADFAHLARDVAAVEARRRRSHPRRRDGRPLRAQPHDRPAGRARPSAAWPRCRSTST